MKALEFLKTVWLAGGSDAMWRHGGNGLPWESDLFRAVLRFGEVRVSFSEKLGMIFVSHCDQVDVALNSEGTQQILTPRSVHEWIGLDIPFNAGAANLIHAIETVAIRGSAL